MSASAAQRVDPAHATLWARHYPGHDMIGTRTFGFWLYMLTDAMVYAALFATLGVLSHVVNLAGGPSSSAFINPVYAYGQTIILFLSVLMYGYSMVVLKNGNRGAVIGSMSVAMLLGVVYLVISGIDIGNMFAHGVTPQVSGFLSIFFTIIIYHALHVVVGVIWMLVMMVQIAREGFSANVVYRLINLRLFWHFQAVIWVFVFTFVYLQGMVA